MNGAMQKDLVRRWYEVMWNHWKEAVFDRILDPAIELRSRTPLRFPRRPPRPRTRTSTGPSGVAALACRRDELTREELGRRDALSEALKRSTEEVIETSDGWAFRLRADPAVFSAAAEWVILERRCCPFLRFELRWAGGAAAPWLRLGGGEWVKEYLAPGARALMTHNSPT